MEEYKGFKIGDKVRIRTEEEVYKNGRREAVPEPFLRRFGGYKGTIYRIENSNGRIWVSIGGNHLSNPIIGNEHIEMLLEHRILVPDELFEI